MIIGIDPHKSSHTAVAVDPATNTTVASLRIDASLDGYRTLLKWGRQFGDRVWAIENAKGLGCHLGQWLVTRNETVVDVATTATARVRELSRGGRRKNDVIDAAAAACVAALHGDAVEVTPDDETTVFALLEERRTNVAGQRVRAVNQLHALLSDLIRAAHGPGRQPSGRLVSWVRFARPRQSNAPARAWHGTWYVTFVASTSPLLISLRA